MLSKLKIKYIQTLGQKKLRDEDRLFIAEGPKLVGELLQEPGVRIREIFALPDWLHQQASLLQNIPAHEITAEELEKISQLSTPNKVLAIVHQFPEQPPVSAKGNFVLALDTIQDPGNMGTLIRIADWFGVKHIVASMDTVDLYNPKVVQSTMGSLARVQVQYVQLASWLQAQPDVRIYAAVLDGKNIHTMDKITEGVLLIGNESKGISEEILSLANVRVSIPRKGRAESLNAAVAAGIMLSHFI